MKPAEYIAPAQYPENTKADNVPAFVLEIPVVKVVRIWHAAGALHVNVRRCVERYTARGWRIGHVHHKAQVMPPRFDRPEFREAA